MKESTTHADTVENNSMKSHFIIRNKQIRILNVKFRKKMCLNFFGCWFNLFIINLKLWVVCQPKILFMGNVPIFPRKLWEVCHFFMPNVSKQLWVVCSWVVKSNKKV